MPPARRGSASAGCSRRSAPGSDSVQDLSFSPTSSLARGPNGMASRSLSPSCSTRTGMLEQRSGWIVTFTPSRGIDSTPWIRGAGSGRQRDPRRPGVGSTWNLAVGAASGSTSDATSAPVWTGTSVFSEQGLAALHLLPSYGRAQRGTPHRPPVPGFASPRR